MVESFGGSRVAGGLQRARWGRRVWKALRVVSAVSACAAMLGCGRPDPDVLLARGERLILDGKWHESMTPLKQCLLVQPENAGAHFYLGRAYLNARFAGSLPPRRFTVALGELETARQCFLRQNKPKVLDRYTTQEFETMCHVMQAHVHLRKLEFGISSGLPPSIMGSVVQDMESATNAARAVMPESTDVKDLDIFIAQMKQAGMVLEPPPSLVAPPGDVLEPDVI